MTVARHDLSAVASRREILHRLNQALDECEGGRNVSVIYIDIDGFRSINELYGESVGDEILTEVRRRIQSVCQRGEASEGWLGGDEFLVVLDEPAAVGYRALEIATAIERTIEGSAYRAEGRAVRLTASFGIATTDGDVSARELLRWAHRAMIRAKSAPMAMQVYRRYHVSEPIYSDPELAEELNVALRERGGDGLFLVYQPIFDLTSSKVAGIEALIRWDHPTRGVLAPGEFFPTAHTSRISRYLDQWVIDRALGDFAELRQLGIAPDFVSVNLTGSDLATEGAADEICNKVLEVGLEPEQLVIELTESDLSADYIGDIAESLWDLRDYGIKVALDDFGTGSSSVTHLDSFPANVLKIDKAMVLGVGENRARVDLIRGVVSLAKSIGLEVIAEGVDSTIMVDNLARFGCDFGQGFFLAVPTVRAEIEELLRVTPR